MRRDVGEGLVGQGIAVLRQGGFMVNAAGYRWKKMIGPRERRRPYSGSWYDYASNGWGIFDFLNFCEAAGFLGIPAVNANETPADLADFAEYVNGTVNTEWGKKRAADGRAKPYCLKFLEIGNEERVDEDYWLKFKSIAEAVWAKDPEIILVVGDFAYTEPIRDPYNFRGSASGITSLAAHRKILELGKKYGCEVWFDVHVGRDGPRPDSSLGGALSFQDALAGIADGAMWRVVIFELNAANHSLRRALANGLAIQAIERDGRIPIVTLANCLQPDGQNDNGWDQGLLFLNPSRVWLQPPRYVTQMLAENYQPQLVSCVVQDKAGRLDANAKRSADGHTLVLQVANPTSEFIDTQIQMRGFVPSSPLAKVTELFGPLDAVNTADQPERCIPRRTVWRHEMQSGVTRWSFRPYSFTVIRFEGALE